MKNKLNDKIKKYPVFYQGEEYEIRIEEIWYKEPFYDYLCWEYIVIYRSTVGYHLSKIFNKDAVFRYKRYSVRLNYIKEKYHLTESDENYYVDLFKCAFKEYLNEHKKDIDDEITNNKQIKALENWDGVIS